MQRDILLVCSNFSNIKETVKLRNSYLNLDDRVSMIMRIQQCRNDSKTQCGSQDEIHKVIEEIFFTKYHLEEKQDMTKKDDIPLADITRVPSCPKRITSPFSALNQ